MGGWNLDVEYDDAPAVDLLKIPFECVHLHAASDGPSGPPDQVVIEIQAPPVDFAGHPLGIIFRNPEDLRSFASSLLEMAIECWGPTA